MYKQRYMSPSAMCLFNACPSEKNNYQNNFLLPPHAPEDFVYPSFSKPDQLTYTAVGV